LNLNSRRWAAFLYFADFLRVPNSGAMWRPFLLGGLRTRLIDGPIGPRSARTMLDRDVKEPFIGFAAIVLFAAAIVYLRQ
jgi:hypothetical protein